MAEKNREVDLLMQLLTLPGPSGGEEQVAEFLVNRLKAVGLSDGAIAFDQANRKSPHGGAIGNLAVLMPGTVKAPRRMLSAHMDTVPLCAGARPRIGARL
jgi:tripeptide aminopeptidase